ncbi:MAG: response regulator [Nitrospinae bacterium]|nr:response regulator [Nitrospinota bacterium]
MTRQEDTGKEVLIVEDSAVQMEILRRVLTTNGYKVRKAGNGEEALAAAHERKPDMIISDILMPVMDGYTLCKELKASETLKEIPVILLTQLSEPEEAIRGLEAGADNYITKPFDEAFLLAKVKSLLLYPIHFMNDPGKKSIEFIVDGKRYSVKSSRGQTLNFLLSTYENVVRRNLEMYRVQEELERLNEQLEDKIKQRTAALAEEVTERKQLSVDLIKRNRELSALYSIYKTAAEKPMLRDILHAALETILGVMEMDAGIMYLLDEDKANLSLCSQVGMGGKEAEPFLSLKIGEGMAGKSAAEMKTIVSDNDNYPTKRLSGFVLSLGMKSMAAAPLISTTDLVGAMSLGSKRPRVFQRDELDLMSAIGRQVGSMVHAARLYEQLKESEEKFQSMAYSVNDAVISIDGQGTIEFWNAAAGRIFGVEKDQAMGKNISMIVPEKHREAHLNGLRNFRETGIGNIFGRSVELTALKADNSEIPVELSVSSYKLGGAWHAVGIVRDITERKKWETSIEESNRKLETALEDLKKSQGMLIRTEKLAALGALSAGVAHEIKNPLNIISTAVQMLMMDEKQPPETIETCKEIMTQIHRTVKITENLRDFARERKPEMKELDPRGLLSKTIALVDYEMTIDNVHFNEDFADGGLRIKGDQDQLAQVFLNLINNAADSIRQKEKTYGYAALKENGWRGEIKIRAWSDPAWTYIEFRDTGLGIADGAVERIFDPFFTTKGEQKGTGLGLSIAFGIMENHGGAISVASVEGEGAAFTLKFPSIVQGH